MKTKWMLVPKTITTAARLTLVLGVVMPAVLLVGSGQAHLRLLQLSDKVDHTAGFALLAFTAFLASHRLRRVHLVNDLMALRGSMDVARKITLRDGEISDLFAEASGRLRIWLRSSIDKSRTLMRHFGSITDPRMPLSQ